MDDGTKAKANRRRRSSSLLYQEPPESLEQLTDQSALPNLNANWVNAKGQSGPSQMSIEVPSWIWTSIPGKQGKAVIAESTEREC